MLRLNVYFLDKTHNERYNTKVKFYKQGEIKIMAIIKKIIVLFILICLLTGVKCFATTGNVNAPNGLVLRESASKDADPITTISNNETVEIIETEEEWYKVKFENFEGYLYKQYVEVNENEVVENTNVEEPIVENTNVEEPIVENTDNENVTNITENTTNQEVYPKQATTKINGKVYIMPSLASTVINNIEEQKEITITKSINSWLYVQSDDISGWIRKSIVEISDITEEIAEEQEEQEDEKQLEQETEPKKEETYESKKGYVNVSSSANIREEANTSSLVVTTLTNNTEVTIIGEEGEWYKITYGNYTGYISKNLVSDTQSTTTSRGNIDRNSTNSEETNNTSTQSAPVTDETLAGGEKIAAFARQYVGNASYVYGGTTPNGFDCSGFVYYVFNSCGYSLSRSCGVQASSGVAVTKDELLPGDILFFNNTSDGSIGHVGIYVGGGTMVHAANTRRGVTTDTINSGYYNTYYYSARRIAY